MAHYVPKHFKKEELLPPSLAAKYTDDSWVDMFDRNLLIVADRLRDHYGYVMVINNWHSGGQFSQRGFRDDPKVGAPKSAHKVGRAFDADFYERLANGKLKLVPAPDMRKKILADAAKFPEIRRMEIDVNWVHIDTVDHVHGKQIYLFKP